MKPSSLPRTPTIGYMDDLEISRVSKLRIWDDRYATAKVTFLELFGRT